MDKGFTTNVCFQVCKPMYVMLLRWICDGTLEDPFNEFFIASDPKVSSDRLWHDKYSIRHSMIPKFMSLSWAKKILATGKSINFLHEVSLNEAFSEKCCWFDDKASVGCIV